MDIKNVVYLIVIIFIFGCDPKGNEVYFCNEYINKYIKFTIDEDYELLNKPELKNYVNISLRYKNYNSLHYIYFGTRMADLYTNGVNYSNYEFASMVSEGLQDDPEVDTIYQINCLNINELNYVTYSVRKKEMGHNIWFESIQFNLIDSIVLLVRTTDFDENNNFEFVQSKHFDLLNSIEFGACYN